MEKKTGKKIEYLLQAAGRLNKNGIPVIINIIPFRDVIQLIKRPLWRGIVRVRNVFPYLP